jgi:c(7)-type cytochrome triheme protein
MDIIFTDTGSMPYVRFPHLSHTLWLDCSNCHPSIFVQKKGANNIAMTDILQGRFCGLCHGKVSFPPTLNCTRCHSVPQKVSNK